MHKHSTHVAPLFHRRGAKCAKFWPKFRPQSSLDHRIFELGDIIGKQKQTCQGPMTGLPPYQTWGGWVPPTPTTVGALAPERVNMGPRHISEIVTGRKLKFYIRIDRSKYSFRAWKFPPLRGLRGAAPPSANLAPPRISETIRARKSKFYTHLYRVKYTFGEGIFLLEASQECTPHTVNVGPLISYLENCYS